MALNFEKYANEGEKFLNEIAEELGNPEDTPLAGRIMFLRTFLSGTMPLYTCMRARHCI